MSLELLSTRNFNTIKQQKNRQLKSTRRYKEKTAIKIRWQRRSYYINFLKKNLYPKKVMQNTNESDLIPWRNVKFFFRFFRNNKTLNCYLTQTKHCSTQKILTLCFVIFLYIFHIGIWYSFLSNLNWKLILLSLYVYYVCLTSL